MNRDLEAELVGICHGEDYTSEGRQMSEYSRTGARFGSQTVSRTGVARSWGNASGERPDQVWALGSIRFPHQVSTFSSAYEILPFLLCWQ